MKIVNQKHYLIILFSIIVSIILLSIGAFSSTAFAATPDTTWVKQTLGPLNDLRSVSFIDENEGWAVGRDDVILHTVNGGDHWNRQFSETYRIVYTSVQFIDTNTGWIVGTEGTIVYTVNGGKNWIEPGSGTTNSLLGVSFLDKNEGWAVGLGGTILHTENGGKAWVRQNSSTGNTLSAISFLNAENGWAVGQHGTILHTVNGGETWVRQTIDTTLYLYSVQFIDENNGWISGNDGTILHTTDGGTTWKLQTTPTEVFLYKVQFLDKNNGWAVGRDGTILHTINGGENWKLQTTPTSIALNSISLVGGDNGWAVGDDVILKGTNLSNSPPSLNPLYDVYVKQNQPISFRVAATDPDIPKQSLSYSITGNPIGATINSSTGDFSWTPNESQTGTHSITFTVTDNGTPVKSDSKSISFVIADTIPPIITVVGSSATIELTATNTYTELGATVTDNDPAYSESVIITGDSPDTSTVGVYTVRYDAPADDSGNQADTISRTVNVVDTVLPTFNVDDNTGNFATSIPFTGTYTPGVIANESDLSGIASSIIGGDIVNVNTAGVYTVTYTVTDNSGLATIITETVTVGPDTDSPVITLTGSSATIELTATNTYTELGATVTDNDPAYSESVIITGDSPDTSAVGVYTVRYDAPADDSGNQADTISRTVNVVDTVLPTFNVDDNTGNFATSIPFTGTYTPGVIANESDLSGIASSIIGGDIVNVNTAGVYTVTYTVTDNSGLATIITETVTVGPDTDSPVITLTGSSATIELTATNTYTELGATVTDNDPAYSESVIITGDSPDTSAVGVYTVRYDAPADDSGNQADTISRTVNVVDTVLPTFNVDDNTGNFATSIPFTGTYTPGVIANESDLSGIASSIIGGDIVNVNTAGVYTVTYTVTDNSGLATIITETVTVGPDTDSPVITLTGSSATIELTATNTYTELGATVTDNDPAYSESVIITGDSPDTSTVGVYTVRYDAPADDSGNQADTISRTVNVVDTVLPTFNVDDNTGNFATSIPFTGTYTPGVIANESDLSGIASSIIGGDIVNVNTAGVYTVTYTVTDNSGLATIITETVTVGPDTDSPVITLTGSSATIELTATNTYTELGATVTDNDPAYSESVIITGDSPDTSTVGVYTVRYDAPADDSGNQADTISRTVNVVDTVLPTFNVDDNTGNFATSIPFTGTYTPGVIANESDLSGIASSIIGGDIVNVNTAGVYTVTYTVTDNSGLATIITETVTVGPDTDSPVITLTGSSATIELTATNTYTELGATVTDNDPAYSESVIITGDSPDTSAVGVYTVRYDAPADDSGNQADTISRTVNVVDTVLPTFNVDDNTGNFATSIPFTGTYTPGVIANESDLSGIASSIIGGDIVNVNTAGVYTVTYTVTDNSGLATIITETVTVGPDTDSPVITLTGSSATIELTATNTYTELGATVTDNDPAYSESVIITGDSPDTSTVGVYTVRYDAPADDSGNQADTISRTVNVVDTVLPTFNVDDNTGNFATSIPFTGTYTPGVIANESDLSGIASSIIGGDIVNVNTAGVYTVTYTVTDNSGLATIITETVTVGPDTDSPVITLTGSSATIELTATNTYTELGATVTDNDPAYSESVIITGDSPDTSTVGVYTVRYDAPADDSGNQADTISRTVNVVDTVLPTFNVDDNTGNFATSIPFTGTYTPGVIANESDLSGIASSIIGGDIVNVNTAGVYTVTYTVTDNSGLATIITETVTVGPDTDSPVITLTGSSATIELTATNTYTELGATVTDNDPAYSESVIITGDSPDTSTVGVYTVRYDAPADDSGNQADTISRTVNVVDTVLPTFNVDDNTGNFATSIPFTGTYTPGVIANESDLSGIASSIIGGDIVNVNTAGVYTVTYTVTDNSGLATIITETVTVGPDTDSPVITLTGSSATIELTATNTYTELGATVTDNDPAYSESVIITGDSPDTSTVGVYTVRYDAPADDSGNQADTISRTVNVVDTVLPTFNVDDNTGNFATSIPFTGTYTPGVIANESDLSGIASSIIGGDIVNVNTAGVYTVTYTVTDNSGLATIITETVTVGPDTDSPVITLTGSSATIELTATNTYTELGATVTDNDPAYSESVIITGDSPDTSTVGVYTVRYDAPADDSGNQADTISRTVNVVDTVLPTFNVDDNTGNFATSIPFTGTYTPGVIANESDLSGIASSIIGGDIVNVNTAGVYTVTYTVTDNSGLATIITETVTVGPDTDSPVITLTGSSATIELTATNTYTELGATVTDNDPAYSESVIITGDSPDTSTVGVYTVRYDAPADDSGNQADTISRTVNVVDTVLPTFNVDDNTGNFATSIPFTGTYTPGVIANESDLSGIASSIIGGDIVNVNTAGVYTVTYTVTDNSGLATIITETVTVGPDTDSPVITLTGSSATIELTATNTYTELGATVTDNDPAYVGVISIGGDTVDTSAVGTYTVTYDANDDAAGNSATQQSIIITVQDTTAPTIRVEPTTITLEVNSKSPDLLEGVLTNDGSPITVTGTGNINIPGTYILTYHSTDSAGNIADPVSRTYIIQDTTEFVQPTINQPTTPTNNNSLRVTGTSEVGSTVVLTHNDESYPSVVTNGNGVWGVDVTLTEGENIFTAIATATNSESNSSDPSASVTVTLDTTAPAQPTILQPPTPTTDNSVTITGTGETGSSLVLTRNGVTYDPVTVDSDGNWSVDVILAEKQNTFIATATDSSGNESGNSSPVVIRLDTTPPPTPRITTSSDTVTSSPFTINGGFTGIGIVVTLFNGDTLVTTTTSNDVGEFSFTVPLNEGENTFTVTATDGVGNESAQSNQVTITLNPPNTLSVTITTTDTTVNTESFTISGTSTNADSVALFIDGSLSGATTVPDSDGNWSFDVTLNEGENILGAIVSSVGGFPIASTDDITVTLYIIPPPSVTLVTTDTSVNDKSFTIYGTSTNTDLVTFNVNGVSTDITTPPDSDGNWNFGVILNEGPNVLGATVSGVGGTASTNNITVTLDTTPPIITVNEDSYSIELGGTYTPFTYSATDEVDVDVKVVIGGDIVDVNVLGEYTITFNASDYLDNVSDTVTRTITVAPVGIVTPPTINQPTSPTNNNSLSITGTSPIGSIVNLTQNDNELPFTVNVSIDGTWSHDVILIEGENTFTAIAWLGIKSSGNSNIVNVTYTVDPTNPVVPIVPVNSTNPVVPITSGNSTTSINPITPVNSTSSEQKSGGGSNDWKKKPTFGKSWEITTAQIVENGFTFNGHTLDITDNWHTDFNKTSSIIGEDNHVEIKVYTDKILKYVTLSLGVPEIGDVSNAETDIIVNLQRNYTSPSGYDITGTTHEQKESLVDEDSIISDISKVKCTDDSNDERCYMIGIDFTVNAPLKSDVLAISAVDTNRRSTITYINEGVEFVGESLLEADTHTMFVKNTSQDVGESLLLTQQDRRYNVYEDSNGYLWIVNDHGSWIQITKPDFERHVDSSNGVMTRTHSGFTDLVLAEQDKAILVFDGTTLLSITPESFAHDYPEYLDGSLDKILLEKLSVEEILALEKSLNRLIYDDNW